MIHVSPKCTISELMAIVSAMEWGDIICVSRHKQAAKICEPDDYYKNFVYTETRNPSTRKVCWLFLRISESARSKTKSHAA